MLAKHARSLNEIVPQTDGGEKVKCLQNILRVADITSLNHMQLAGHGLQSLFWFCEFTLCCINRIIWCLYSFDNSGIIFKPLQITVKPITETCTACYIL
jgi:hypothetical protein